MFSSKDLISFVFANENDTYYGDDLLKRDLNQYLWERLHENYESVYFLSAEDDSFRVRSYGDLRCNEYTPKKKKIFGLLGSSSDQSDLGNWIQRQLCAKSDSTAAFVCSLDDFCSVLSDPKWYPTLESIAEDKKRTGIFVLTASATAEKSANMLLTSPVFEKLHETAITDLRDGAPRDLYGTLKKRKWDNCIFLNSFTWERVHDLLLHLVVEYPDRYESCEKLDTMSEYLYTYLRDPDFAREEFLFAEEYGFGYPMYEELFTRLKNERNWKNFEKKVAAFEKSERKRQCTDLSPNDVAVLRSPNSYAGRCMIIRLPDWLNDNPQEAEKAQATLQSIYSEVIAPKSKVENPEIISFAEKLINRLDTVAVGDAESYNFVLSTLKFCVDHIYSPHNDEKTAGILSILQKKQDAIGIFDQHFMTQRNLKLMQISVNEGSIQSITLQQLNANFYILDQAKKKFVDLIDSMELNLEMSAKSSSISEVLETLTLEIKNIEKNLADIPKNKPLSDVAVIEPLTPMPEPEPEIYPEPEPPEKEQEDIFVITDEDRNFIPPIR